MSVWKIDRVMIVHIALIQWDHITVLHVKLAGLEMDTPVHQVCEFSLQIDFICVLIILRGQTLMIWGWRKKIKGDRPG